VVRPLAGAYGVALLLRLPPCLRFRRAPTPLASAVWCSEGGGGGGGASGTLTIPAEQRAVPLGTPYTLPNRTQLRLSGSGRQL
jgi:hypothetical protein